MTFDTPTAGPDEDGAAEPGFAGERGVVVSPAFFASLRSTWEAIAPQGWPLFCAEWGARWGRLTVMDMEASALAATGEPLRTLTGGDLVARLAGHLQTSGWGRLAADFGAARRGAFVLTVEDSALVRGAGESDGPRCHLLAGFFRAFFSHLAGRLVAARELHCATQGGAGCVFVVATRSQRELDEAITRAGGDLAATLRGLTEH